MNMPENSRTSPFFVLDFDRTLADTDKFHDILEVVIQEETSVKIFQLREARAAVERAGKSFDTVDYLRHFLSESRSEKTWQQIQRVFIARVQGVDMLEPHAADLLRILDEKKLPYGMITFGGEAWQLAKIEGAKLLNVPHIVTHIQQKGEILAGWKKASGDFIVPPALTRNFRPLVTTSIVFLDDKSVSFEKIPAGVRGIRVRPLTGLKLLSQRGRLPEGVEEVDGMLGAIALLFGKEYEKIT